MASRRSDGVFVSSVYDELKEYRKAALDAVWRARLVPIGMEREDIAKPVTTSESSRTMLDEASVYVGIFAQRYGVVTIEELRYAEEQGLPILAFIAEQQLNDGDVESDSAHAQELAEIKRDLKARYTVATFRSTEELGIKVLRSLLNLIRDGHLAATESGQVPMETIPEPPAPYYEHPYIGGSRFVGRRSELGLLDAWATSADPMLLVEAIGGSGKSALTWEWVHTHLSAVLPDRKGLVWWSFYESQATVGKFLAHTLAYLSGRPVEACTKLPRNVQEEQLLTLLRTRQVILVLDGVERLLLAYHRHDAAHLADAVVEAEPRRCTDPRDGTLLRALSQAGPSKVLISTRLLPQDLQTRSGQLLHGIRHLPLHGLSGDDAIALLEEEGVHGDATLMRNFLSQFGDHALLIQVLAGRIRAYKPAPGNFDEWYRVVGRRLELRDQMLVSRQASILQAALEDLDPQAFRLLAKLAAFRYPVDYDAVVAINPFRPSGEENREVGLEQLHQALTTLEERGLVQWDREHNRYDMHPVVRAYAYGKLEDREATYAQVKSYFEALPAEDRDAVQDVADLRRTLELYHALLNGGQSDDAVQLFYDRLDRPLRFALGAYATMVELLSPLFTHGFDQPPVVHSVTDQSYAANQLALAFAHLDDETQAQRLYAIGVRLDLQQRDALNLAIGLNNLGSSLQNSGRLAAAERAYRVSLAVSQAKGERDGMEYAQGFLIGLYATAGAWTEGEAAYKVLQASPYDDVKGQAMMCMFAARLRWGQGQSALPLLAKAISESHTDRNLYVEREAQRLAGEMAFARGDLVAAQEAWQEAYSIAQREGIPLGPLLADLARVNAAQHDGGQAKALLTEAVALGGMGVALAAVEVYTAIGEPAEAKHYVDAAYREAWADGPPFAFYHDLGRIRAVLKTLRLPEPKLPPFDARRVPPLPDEAAIRAFIDELKKEQGMDEPAMPSAPVIAAAKGTNGKRRRWPFGRRGNRS